MNDTELDELLDTWSAPPAPAALRRGVRTAFAARPRRQMNYGVRRVLFAGALLGAGAFLFIVTLAFPQTLKLVSPRVPIPYSVDSECIRYSDDGSPAEEVYLTSYNQNGSEIILSRTFPGNPFKTAIHRTLDATRSLSYFLRPTRVSDEQLERVKASARIDTGFASELFGNTDAVVRGGCVVGPVVGRETILNHPTVSVQRLDAHMKMTLWMAPDLSCFALRMTIEKKGSDGTFRLLSAKHAVRVILNP
jgi:hypothetical protein